MDLGIGDTFVSVGATSWLQTVVDGFLFLTPYTELAIGLGLLYTPLKHFFTHTWCLYFVTLEFGHYVLEQWPSVNEMIPIILMGAFCIILPEHKSWFTRMRTS